MSTLRSLAARSALTPGNRVKSNNTVLATPVCEALIDSAIETTLANLKNQLTITDSGFEADEVVFYLTVGPSNTPIITKLIVLVPIDNAPSIGANLRQLCNVAIPTGQAASVIFDRDVKDLYIEYLPQYGLTLGITTPWTNMTIAIDIDSSIATLSEMAAILEDA